MGKNEYLSSSSHGGSPWNSVYNDDQKRVLRAYNDSIKDGVYYLFFIDNVTDKKDGNGTMVSGYIPRGYNCGFIYDGGSPHTIAHELGHGIAGLEHVFENSKSSGKTNNLMDYASGEELWHFQWDAIQDPSRVWMKWNKDESEGENIEELELRNLRWYSILDHAISGEFVAPSEWPIWINEVNQFFVLKETYYGISLDEKHRPDEAIYGFKTSDNKTFVAKFDSFSGRFVGFYNGDTLYVDKDNETLMHYHKDGYPVHYWSISDSTFNTKFFVAPKNPVGDEWCLNNYSAVIPDFIEIAHQKQLETLIKQKVDGQCQYWFYDVKNNKIIVVTNYTGGQLLRKKNGESIALNKIRNAEIMTYPTMADFAESEYNWLANDVRATINEAGKYVAVGMGLTIALPLLIESAGAAVPAYLQVKIKDFAIDFTTDFICAYVVNIISYYLTHDCSKESFGGILVKVWSDNWSEMLLDATIAGGKALLPTMSKTKRKLINASIDGVQALEMVKICKNISGTATSDEKTNFTEQAFNFAIGVGMSFLSEKLAKNISIRKFKKNHYIAVLRQTLKNMKMSDDEIATFIYQTVKACNHPIFKDLTEADEKIIKRLLKTDDGAILLDIACRNNISNAQTINLLSYCKSKFDVGIRNVDLRIDPKIVEHLDYIANNLDEEGCRLVNNILNISNPEKVLPDLAETLRLFENEGIKKEWIRQYYNYIKQETIVFNYQGQAYKYKMPKTIGEIKNTFTDIKVSSKIEFIEFHAIDKDGNPCWCFYHKSKNLYFVPIEDEVSGIYKWVGVSENMLSNYLRSDHFKIKVGIKEEDTKNEN